MEATASLEWAEQEFGRAALGNALRTRRLVRLGAAVLRSPGGTVTSVLKEDAEREGAFRLVENRRVSAAAIARSSHLATARRCSGAWVWVAVDQTTLSITDHDCAKGLGPAGDGRSGKKRGAEVMSALAVSQQGTPLGLLAQCWWRRSDEPSPSYSCDQREVEDRESDLWIQALQNAQQNLQQSGANCRPWFQLDRGGDFWRVFDYADQHGAWVTARSAYDRCLWDRDEPLHQFMARARCRGAMDIIIPALRQPKKPVRKARVARVAVRFEPVTLELTDSDKDKILVDLTAVHIAEKGNRKDRIQWCLLTTYPVKDFADAVLVVRGYTMRWRIEDFHRTWKTGACNVERSQLRSPDAFCRWATILAAVASRIEQLKHLSRTTPQAPATDFLTQTEIDAAIILSETRKFFPGDALTLHQAVELIARAGGYTGKSSGGPPGSITIARGLRDVLAAAAVADRLRKPDQC